MNITDTGTDFIFDDGKFSHHFQYGGNTVGVTGVSLDFKNKYTDTSEGLSANFPDITLNGIVGVTNAAELALYIMEK